MSADYWINAAVVTAVILGFAAILYSNEKIRSAVHIIGGWIKGLLGYGAEKLKGEVEQTRELVYE